MNIYKKSTNIVFLFFALFFFHGLVLKEVFAEPWNCAPIAAPAEPSCRTGESPLGSPIVGYKCVVNKENNSTDCRPITYAAGLVCGGKVGSGLDPYYCEHPNTFKGYHAVEYLYRCLLQGKRI